MTTSLDRIPAGKKVARILAAAINAVDPEQAVHQHVRKQGDILWVDEQPYDLKSYRRIYVVGAGKASLAMAKATVELLGDNLTGGAVITKVVRRDSAAGAQELSSARIKVLPGAHPLPDERNIDSTHQVMQILDRLGPSDLVICLISGGGSALLTAPAGRVTLQEMRTATDILLSCGATINELNLVRKHIDRVKGGGLARMIFPAQVIALILSDVVGNPLEVIASGPTAPDESTYADAEQILGRFHIKERIPASIMDVLKTGEAGLLSETLKRGDPILERVHNTIIASNQNAAQAGVTQAQVEGFNSLLMTTHLQGEARLAGGSLAATLRQMALYGQPLPRPACIIAGGETTVTIKGHGKGGRNQELALACVDSLRGLDQVALIALATDGEDGPTDAAGAVVTGDTAANAEQAHLLPEDYLDQNNSYEFFGMLGDRLMTGSTGTNVNDLSFLFTFED